MNWILQCLTVSCIFFWKLSLFDFCKTLFQRLGSHKLSYISQQKFVFHLKKIVSNKHVPMVQCFGSAHVSKNSNMFKRELGSPEWPHQWPHQWPIQMSFICILLDLDWTRLDHYFTVFQLIQNKNWQITAGVVSSAMGNFFQNMLPEFFHQN